MLEMRNFAAPSLRGSVLQLPPSRLPSAPVRWERSRSYPDSASWRIVLAVEKDRRRWRRFWRGRGRGLSDNPEKMSKGTTKRVSPHDNSFTQNSRCTMFLSTTDVTHPHWLIEAVLRNGVCFRRAILTVCVAAVATVVAAIHQRAETRPTAVAQLIEFPLRCC